MALTPRLDLRQSQSLVMTPQLQQAIKLLQFSSLDLLDYVEHELEENPLLERDEDENRENDPLYDKTKLSEEIAENGAEDVGLDVIDFSNPEKDAEEIGSDMDMVVVAGIDANPDEHDMDEADMEALVAFDLGSSEASDEDTNMLTSGSSETSSMWR